MTLDRSQTEALVVALQEWQERRSADPLWQFTPTAKQAPFIRSVLHAERPENWFVAANRSGKTKTGAYIGACLARFGVDPKAAYSEGGAVAVLDRATSGWVSALDFRMSEDVLQPYYFDNGKAVAGVEAFIPPREIAEWRASDQLLKLKNGSIIGFKSADSGRAKYQGADKDWVHMDEEHPKGIYEEIVIRVGARTLRVFGTATLLPPEGQVGGVTWVYTDIIQPWQSGLLSHVGIFGASIYDNPHIRREEIARLEAIYPEGSVQRQIRLEGKWLPGLSGARAYPRFDRRLHTRPQAGPLPRRPLCWLWDFNVEPMVSIVGQRDGALFRVFKDLVLDEGDIGEMCEMFVQAFPHHLGEIWVYGDSTGKHRAAQTGKSCYDLIMNYMKTYGSPVRLKVPTENPFVADRINAVQRLLKDEHGHIRVEIDPTCTELVADFEQTLRDSRGGLKKTHDRKDPYYRRSHLTDAFGYWAAYDEPVRVASFGQRVAQTIALPGYGWSTTQS